MLSPLKFVQGAVAKKDFQPALTHFRIKDGRVTGFNGVIALSSPIDIDIDATPKALPFVKAIERCEAPTIAIGLTPGGRLSLKSGRFRALIECAEETDVLDGITPDEEDVPTPVNLLAALSTLEQFVSEDASRLWSRGVLLRGQSAYATNNIVVVEYWVGGLLPEVNVPLSAVKELKRIKQNPIRTCIGDNTITFHFEGGRWLRSQLYDPEWPDVEPILNQQGSYAPIPNELYEAVEALVPFVEEEGRIYFREGRVTTAPFDNEGASVEIEGLPDRGAYHFKHLLSLKGVAKEIDFSFHPKPCPWLGDRVRGVILGMVDD